MFNFLKLTALSFLVACILSGCGKTSNLPEFEVDAYVSNPGNLTGNRYALIGNIDAHLEFEEGVGRLVSVRPNEGDPRLPVFIHDNLRTNVHVGQRYVFEVVVRKGGLIYVETMEKY